MAVTTYKCPNCDGGLIFDPKSQQFSCEYCGSYFDESNLTKTDGAENSAPREAPEPGGREARDEPSIAVYSCPSCGAEVETDETTAATFCYYCHNPVVLSGRLDGKLRPQKVIPFAVEKEKAIRELLNWTKKKWFVPKAFFSQNQIEKVTGVYFPYWMVDGRVRGRMDARATKVRVWRSGNTEYTETRHYSVVREGNMTFQDIAHNALNKENSKLVNGVHPFDGAAMRDFSPAYLSGFQAEKRNREQAECEGAVKQEIQEYAGVMLRNSISGYHVVTPGQLSVSQESLDWKYTLLPVWVLTYKAHNGETHYYTMNGQTGKVSGILPVDYRRLFLFFGGITLVLLLIMLLGGYLF